MSRLPTLLAQLGAPWGVTGTIRGTAPHLRRLARRVPVETPDDVRRVQALERLSRLVRLLPHARHTTDGGAALWATVDAVVDELLELGVRMPADTEPTE